MRFHAQRPNTDVLSGLVTNEIGDAGKLFCDYYRCIGRSMFDEDHLRIEPVVWADNAFTPEIQNENILRIPYSLEEQPELFKAVFNIIGTTPSDEDIVVLMRPKMMLLPTTADYIVPSLMFDGASVIADMEGEINDLGRLSADIIRSSIAAVILKSSERLFESADAIDRAYIDIGNAGIVGMMGTVPNITDMNFVKQHPGVATLLKNVIDAGRNGPALPLPLDLEVVQEIAFRNVELSLAELRPFIVKEPENVIA